jgi:hypothetical protein
MFHIIMRTQNQILGKYTKTEFFMKCILSFKFFAEECLKFTSNGERIYIQPFQERWVMLAESNEGLVIEAATGLTKTETMGSMYPLWKMFKEKNLRILLVSDSLSQSKGNMLERMKQYITDNEFLSKMLIPDNRDTTWNKEEIRTKNGHWVKVVPYSDRIRGYRADIIICDEVDAYDDTNIFFEHVTSRLFEGGKLICTSTPKGPTRLIAILRDKAKQGELSDWYFEKTPILVKEDGSKAYTCAPENVTYEMIKDCVSVWPELYSTKNILKKWYIQGKWNFMSNNMAEVVGDAEDAMFPVKYIMKAFDRTIDFTNELDINAEYFIGADFAISDGPKADFDFFTVVKKKHGQYTVVRAEQWKGKDIPFKVERLECLFNYYNETDYGCTLVVDESNFGKEVERQILSRGVPVIPRNFYSVARKKLIDSLAQIFKSGTITIPRNPNPEFKSNIDCVEYGNILKDQLTGFIRHKSEKTGSEFPHSTAPHDDGAISLALAIIEAIGREVGDDDEPMQLP